MKVENMSGSSGRPVANQFIIKDGNREYFQSYGSLIAMVDSTHYPPKVYLDEGKWDYSTTTGKYRNQFLGEDIQTTRKKIKSGEYELVDLEKFRP